jgi:Flp pilus assembly protein TadD
MRALGVAVLIAVGLIAAGYVVWQERSRPSVEAAARLLDEGDQRAALRALLAAVAATPTDARAHYYLALAYARIGQHEGALHQMREAVRLAPNDARFHNGLGQAYRETGDLELARGEFEKAIDANRGTPRYQVDLAGVLLDEGLVKPAIEALRRAVAVTPHSAELHILLAQALCRAGDRDATTHEYREAVRTAGDQPIAEVARQELRAALLDNVSCH